MRGAVWISDPYGKPMFDTGLGLVPQKPSMSSVANVITCLYNYEATGVPTESGIRAGLTVGNPCYWSMLSLVFAKLFEKLQII